MSALGWIFMAVSWGFILVLTVFCFYRVLSSPANDATVTEEEHGRNKEA